MPNLIPFQFENSNIRVVVIDDAPWFSARDVALALGYKNPSEAYNDHCKRLKLLSYSESLELNWGNPNPRGEYVIPEGDVYRLAAKSQLESAQRFESWVYDEVLPSIRKTGRYSLPQPVRPQPTAMDVADWVFARLPNLCERSRQEIVSRTANKIAGFEMIPLPKITEQFWTAGELAKEFGCTANRIGRIANAHGLKTGEYGEHRLSKSKHSTRQVEMFFYNEKGRAALARLVLEIATH